MRRFGLIVLGVVVLVGGGTPSDARPFRARDGLYVAQGSRDLGSFQFWVARGGTRLGGFSLYGLGCSDVGLPRMLAVGRRGGFGGAGPHVFDGILDVSGRIGRGGVEGQAASYGRSCTGSVYRWSARRLATPAVRGALLAGPVVAGSGAAWIERPGGRGPIVVRVSHGGRVCTLGAIGLARGETVTGLSASPAAVALGVQRRGKYGAISSRVFAGLLGGRLRRIGGSATASAPDVSGAQAVDDLDNGVGGGMLLTDLSTGRATTLRDPSARPVSPSVAPHLAGRYVSYLSEYSAVIEVARIGAPGAGASMRLAPLYSVRAQGTLYSAVSDDGSLVVVRPDPTFLATGLYDVGFRELGNDAYHPLPATTEPVVPLAAGRVVFAGRRSLKTELLHFGNPPRERNPPRALQAVFPTAAANRIGGIDFDGQRIAYAFRSVGPRGRLGPVQVAVRPL